MCPHEEAAGRCIYVKGHGGEHFIPVDRERTEDSFDDEIFIRVLTDRCEAAEAENARLERERAKAIEERYEIATELAEYKRQSEQGAIGMGAAISAGCEAEERLEAQLAAMLAELKAKDEA